MRREKNNKNLFINFHTWEKQEKQFGAINFGFRPAVHPRSGGRNFSQIY